MEPEQYAVDFAEIPRASGLFEERALIICTVGCREATHVLPEDALALAVALVESSDVLLLGHYGSN